MSKTLSIAKTGKENDELKLENLANQAGLPAPALRNKILVAYARDNCIAVFAVAFFTIAVMDSAYMPLNK